jgi:hypothetical protein
MSESGSDQEIVTETAQRKSSSRANDGTELSTDGAVSLFSTVLTNALEQQKINIIQHFESRFVKNEKQTGVEAGDLSKRAIEPTRYRNRTVSFSLKGVSLGCAVRIEYTTECKQVPGERRMSCSLNVTENL